MVDETVILAAERLRDDLEDLRSRLRKRYIAATRQVTADDLRTAASRAAERWLVEISGDPPVVAAIGSKVAADLSVHFQRLLTFTEHATVRRRYDAELKAILKDYSINVVLPLKTARGRTSPTLSQPRGGKLTAFIGQSFATADESVNQCIADVLIALGVTVVTGEKPKADSISEKVKELIEAQAIFVGIFTRREKIARKPEWTTSPWVIDEKAYAVGRQKQLVLLKEQGVGSIGGIQGDYEFLEFSRHSLEILVIRIVQLFSLANAGLR